MSLIPSMSPPRPSAWAIPGASIYDALLFLICGDGHSLGFRQSAAFQYCTYCTEGHVSRLSADECFGLVQFLHWVTSLAAVVMDDVQTGLRLPTCQVDGLMRCPVLGQSKHQGGEDQTETSATRLYARFPSSLIHGTHDCACWRPSVQPRRCVSRNHHRSQSAPLTSSEVKHSCILSGVQSRHFARQLHLSIWLLLAITPAAGIASEVHEYLVDVR